MWIEISQKHLKTNLIDNLSTGCLDFVNVLQIQFKKHIEIGLGKF